MRWVVGDVQGCARELQDLLDEIRFDPSRDELWSIGDLINRGPDSLAAARLWRDTGGRGVIGNHEVYALAVRAGRWPRKSDDLDALFAADDGDVILDHMRDLPALVKLPGRGAPVGDVFLVHAGVHPQWDLDAMLAPLGGGAHDLDWVLSEDVSWATRARCCDAEGHRSPFHGKPEDRPDGVDPWDSFYDGPRLVVHGHWAWRGHFRLGHVLGLDSGCVYGGPLTAWCLEEDRVVQVPARG